MTPSSSSINTNTLTNATDVAGKVSFHTNGSVSIGDYLEVDFATAYGLAPIVVISPADATTAANLGSVYITTATSNFRLNMGVATKSTTFTFYYSVIETQ